MEPDIIERVKKEFEKSETALKMLADFEVKNKLSPRISRCIVLMAKGNPEILKKAIEMAEFDWRDVIMCGEHFTFEGNEPFGD